VAQVLVVVADGDLEPDAGVDERVHGPGKHLVEAVLEVAVVADVAEQRDETEGRPLVGTCHLRGHGHGLAPAAPGVAHGHERQPVVAHRPSLPLRG
jgi:hypothetical protein